MPGLRLPQNRTSKAATNRANPSSSSVGGIASQSDKDLETALKKALIDTQEAKRQRERISSTYAEKRQHTRRKIDQIFTTHEKEAKKQRAEQCRKLALLLRKKMEIEEKMVNSVKTLQRAYGLHVEELLSVTKGRMSDLDKL